MWRVANGLDNAELINNTTLRLQLNEYYCGHTTAFIETVIFLYEIYSAKNNNTESCQFQLRCRLRPWFFFSNLT